MSEIAPIMNRATNGPPKRKGSPLAAVYDRMSAMLMRIIAIEQRTAPSQGNDGTGISELIIDARGHLLATLTNGAVKDVGLIPVANGKDADPTEVAALRNEVAELRAALNKAPGRPDGEPPFDRANAIRLTVEHMERVIAETAEKIPPALVSAVVNSDGELIHVFSDGVEKNLGVVRGSAAAAIVDAIVSDEGRLVVTMTNGQRIDAGRVQGRDGETIEESAVMAMVDRAVAALPPAAPGADADPALVEDLVNRKVEAAVAALPPAKDADMEALYQHIEEKISALPPAAPGADADPALVEELVLERVTAAVVALDNQIEAFHQRIETKIADLPPGAPGADADPALVEALVAKKVEAAIAALPPAPAGKDADMDAVFRAISDAVAEIPRPKDGKDADPEGVRLMINLSVAQFLEANPIKTVSVEEISAMVEKAVAALPPAAPGADADMDALYQRIEEKIAALPPAEPGASVDPAEVAEMVSAAVRDVDLGDVTAAAVLAVQALFDAMPKPKDGESVTIEQIAPLVDEAVSKAAASIPAGADGVGIVDLIVDAAGRLQVVTTDKRRIDAGRVVPEAIPGPAGNSLADASVNDEGNLVLRMQDGQEIEAGHVVGKPGDSVKGDAGRGIEKVELRGNDLHATFTDGTEVTVGRVVGKQGKPGEARHGDPGASIELVNVREAHLSPADLALLREAEITLNDGTTLTVFTRT